MDFNAESVSAVLKYSHDIVRSQNIEIDKLFTKDLLEHSENVARIAVSLGSAYNYDFQSLLNIGVGGLLHDYGKVFISNDVLQKPSRLNENELGLVQGHPSRGYRELKKYVFQPEVMQIVLMHHEKLDGSGYPSALSEIPILVQIVTVSDMFEAITANRPYHKATSPMDAVRILRESPGLNQVIVSILSELLYRYKNI